jgi:hypothetical protein
MSGGPCMGSVLTAEILEADRSVSPLAPKRCKGRGRPPLPRQAKSSQELLLASSEDAYIDFGGETHFGAAVL